MAAVNGHAPITVYGLKVFLVFIVNRLRTLRCFRTVQL
jgi:hypothetical protein